MPGWFASLDSTSCVACDRGKYGGQWINISTNVVAPPPPHIGLNNRTEQVFGGADALRNQLLFGDQQIFGTRFDSENAIPVLRYQECQSCAVGRYSDADGAVKCARCPDGTTSVPTVGGSTCSTIGCTVSPLAVWLHCFRSHLQHGPQRGDAHRMVIDRVMRKHVIHRVRTLLRANSQDAPSLAHARARTRPVACCGRPPCNSSATLRVQPRPECSPNRQH